ncbi:hypothetical protein B5S32_g3164 [[Candida] boidinii]|nr:hypothetical protein B5S32_g3164 [[Candida] boidinii]
MTDRTETTIELILKNLQVMHQIIDIDGKLQSDIANKFDVLHKTTGEISSSEKKSTSNPEKVLNEDNDIITKQFENLDLNNEQSNDSLNYLKQAIQNIQDDFNMLQDSQVEAYSEVKKMNDLVTSNNEKVIQRTRNILSDNNKQLFATVNLFNKFSSFLDLSDKIRLKDETFAKFNEIVNDSVISKHSDIYSQNDTDYEISNQFPLNPYIPTGKHHDFSSIEDVYNTIRQMKLCFPHLKLIETEGLNYKTERFGPTLSELFSKNIINHNDSIVTKYSKVFRLQHELQSIRIDPIDWHDRLTAMIDDSVNESSTPIYIPNYQEALKDIYYDGQTLGDWGKLLVAIFHPHQIEYEIRFYINTVITSSTIEPNTSAHNWALRLCSKLCIFHDFVPARQLFFKIYNEFQKRGVASGLEKCYQDCYCLRDFFSVLMSHASDIDSVFETYTDYTHLTLDEVIGTLESCFHTLKYDKLVKIRTEAEEKRKRENSS